VGARILDTLRVTGGRLKSLGRPSPGVNVGRVVMVQRVAEAKKIADAVHPVMERGLKIIDMQTGPVLAGTR